MPSETKTGTLVQEVSWAGGANAWSQIAKAVAPLDDPAICVLPAGEGSKIVKVTGFGFDVPPPAIPTGIEVAFRARCDHWAVRDSGVSLVRAGVISAVVMGDAFGDWPLAYSYHGYGYPDNLAYWLEDYTLADVNHAGFGVALACASVAGEDTAHLDDVRMTLTWVVGGRPKPHHGHGMRRWQRVRGN